VSENLPAIAAEIGRLESMMGDHSSLYWRDESVQARYRDLVDARDGRSVEVESDPSDDAFVSSEMAPVRVDAFQAAGAGGSYTDYLRAVQLAADVVFAVPADERADLIASFNRLPDAVAGAMAAELTNKAGVGFVFCSDAEVRKFSGEPGGRVVREWGAEALTKMGQVRGRLNRCMDTLDDDDLASFLDWLDALTDQQAAAVFRKLAQ
jgi:hypothetical protein